MWNVRSTAQHLDFHPGAHPAITTTISLGAGEEGIVVSDEVGEFLKNHPAVTAYRIKDKAKAAPTATEDPII